MYANADKVQEIIRTMEITKVPNMHEYVEGVINLRGRVIPVIDLCVKLGMERITNDKSIRIIVVEIENSTVGFMVDVVSEVPRIDENIIEAPHAIVKMVNSDYITVVEKLENRLLILLFRKSLINNR